MKKLKAKLKKARKNFKKLGIALRHRRKSRDRAIAELHHLHELIEEVQARRETLQARIKKARKEGNRNYVEKLSRELQENNRRFKKLLERERSSETQKAKDIAAVHSIIERRKWWAKRKTVLRKRIKKAKENATSDGQPKYESWMANGYNDYVTQGVKDFIARGVVNYGLVCTSLRRTYVPPGGSTTSYHLQSPGRAGDIAGSRMIEFQISEYGRNLGNSGCLELFGPDNTRNLKYGNQLTLGEGTGLENLHDTHVHGAF